MKMRYIKDLSDEEVDAYLIDMIKIQFAAVNQIVSVADKYGLDRHEVAKYFSTVMADVAEEAPLEGYELNKEEANANRG